MCDVEGKYEGQTCRRCGKRDGQIQEFVTIAAKSTTILDNHDQLVTTTIRKPVYIKTCPECWHLLRPTPVKRFLYYLGVVIFVIAPFFYSLSLLLTNRSGLFGGSCLLSILTGLGAVLLFIAWYFIATGGIIKPILGINPIPPEQWFPDDDEIHKLIDEGFRPVAFITSDIGFTPEMMYRFEGIHVPPKLDPEQPHLPGQMTDPVPETVTDAEIPPARVMRPESLVIEETVPKELGNSFDNFKSRCTVIEDYTDVEIEGLESPESGLHCVNCGRKARRAHYVLAKRIGEIIDSGPFSTVKPRLKVFHFPICGRCKHNLEYKIAPNLRSYEPEDMVLASLWVLGAFVILGFGFMKWDIWITDESKIPFVTTVNTAVILKMAILFILMSAVLAAVKWLILPSIIKPDTKPARKKYLGWAKIVNDELGDEWIPIYGAQLKEPPDYYGNPTSFLDAFSSYRQDSGWLLQPALGKDPFVAQLANTVYKWPDESVLKTQDNSSQTEDTKCEFCLKNTKDFMDILLYRKELVVENKKRGLLYDFGGVEIPVCRKCRVKHGKIFRSGGKRQWIVDVLFGVLSLLGLTIPLYYASTVSGNLEIEGCARTLASLGIGIGFILIYGFIIMMIFGSILVARDGDVRNPIPREKRIKNIRHIGIINDALHDGWQPAHKLKYDEWCITDQLKDFLMEFLKEQNAQRIRLLDENGKYVKLSR